MARLAGSLVCCLIVLVAGCTTPQPVLKPPPQPEVLTVPPKEARFNNSLYPEVAYRGMDAKFAKPLDAGMGGILPARGMQSGPGMMPTSMGGSMGPGGYR